MGSRDVFLEISGELMERLDQVALAEGRSAPELLAMGLQLVLGLGATSRGVLDWMGREAGPEERAQILKAMGRQSILTQGEVVMARAAERMSAAEMAGLITATDLAFPAPVLLDADLSEQENFGELWEAF